jgi:preprotein translocase subunit Sss1
MVSIGGMSFGGGMNWGAIGNIVGSVLLGILIFGAVGIFIYIIYRSYKNKVVFNIPITLTMILENGTKKERADIKGGKSLNRNSIWDFKVKIPKQRGDRFLGFMPDFGKADADGRLHFITFGDGTLWQQYDSKFETEIVTFKDKFGNTQEAVKIKNLMTPTPNDVKQATINSIKNWRELVDKAKLTAFGIAIGAFIIMVIAHLISLYIQTKVKCGP